MHTNSVNYDILKLDFLIALFQVWTLSVNGDPQMSE